MPPPTPGGGGGQIPASSRYYAKRVYARSTRRPVQFLVPAVAHVPKDPRKECNQEARTGVLGPLIESHYPVVPDGSRANLFAAFDKRCNYYSDKRVDSSIIRASKALLLAICPTALEPLEWTPERFTTWNSQFPPAKQAKHLKVYPDILNIMTKDFSNKDIFVKSEALLKRHDPNWAPRIINQSSDAHNALLGPIMQTCTKRMFNAFSQRNTSDSVNYLGAYKRQADELCSYIERHAEPTTMYIESDFSSNDMTQLRDVHLLEIHWLQWLGAPKWLTGLMLHANSFKVSSRKHGLTARVTNQLATGAQSTTFRNTLWNASINYAFCIRHQARGDCLVLGDDMLQRFDGCHRRLRDIKREYTHVSKLAGMVATVNVYRFLSSCTFLSKHFVPTANGHVLVPKLGKAIARFNCRATNNMAVTDSSYLAGKALSYAYEFRFAPNLCRMFIARYASLSPDGDACLDGLGWNVKGAFLDLGIEGILAAIDSVDHSASRDDLNVFYHSRYGLMYSDVREIVLWVMFGIGDISPYRLASMTDDWLG